MVLHRLYSMRGNSFTDKAQNRQRQIAATLVIDSTAFSASVREIATQLAAIGVLGQGTPRKVHFRYQFLNHYDDRSLSLAHASHPAAARRSDGNAFFAHRARHQQ